MRKKIKQLNLGDVFEAPREAQALKEVLQKEFGEKYGDIEVEAYFEAAEIYSVGFGSRCGLTLALCFYVNILDGDDPPTGYVEFYMRSVVDGRIGDVFGMQYSPRQSDPDNHECG